MPQYKKIIESGDVIEVEVYTSIRRNGTKGIARGTRRADSSEKQKLLNAINAEKRVQRLILNNFKVDDWWLTLIFKEQTDEKTANREFDNFIKRFNYYCEKNSLPRLKYIGCVANGEKRGRWHAHIVIPYFSAKIITAIWKKSEYAARVFYKPLYEDGNYKKLAKYIVDNGNKRSIKRSRGNLIPPEINVKRLTKKERRSLSQGEVPNPPNGYTEDKTACFFNISDVTGITYHMTYIKVGSKVRR